MNNRSKEAFDPHVALESGGSERKATNSTLLRGGLALRRYGPSLHSALTGGLSTHLDQPEGWSGTRTEQRRTRRHPIPTHVPSSGFTARDALELSHPPAT